MLSNAGVKPLIPRSSYILTHVLLQFAYPISPLCRMPTGGRIRHWFLDGAVKRNHLGFYNEFRFSTDRQRQPQRNCLAGRNPEILSRWRRQHTDSFRQLYFSEQFRLYASILYRSDVEFLSYRIVQCCLSGIVQSDEHRSQLFGRRRLESVAIIASSAVFGIGARWTGVRGGRKRGCLRQRCSKLHP